MKFNEWMKENDINMIEDFINQYPREDQPLDDDIPDFIENNAEEYERFCYEVYENEQFHNCENCQFAEINGLYVNCTSKDKCNMQNT